MSELFLEELDLKSIELLERYIKILTLRDKLCSKSRGFSPGNNKAMAYFSVAENDHDFQVIECIINYLDVPFKTKEDAQLVCDILNIMKINPIK